MHSFTISGTASGAENFKLNKSKIAKHGGGGEGRGGVAMCREN